jgi:hypothetical protein
MKTYQIMFNGMGEPELIRAVTPQGALDKYAQSRMSETWEEFCLYYGMPSEWRIVPIERIFVWEKK